MERDQWAFGTSKLKSAEDHLTRVKTENGLIYDGKWKTDRSKIFCSNERTILINKQN